MAYVFENSNLGMPPITFHGVYSPVFGTRTPAWRLGDIQRAYDPTYGGGEFIFLKGVTGTLAGLMVRYNTTDFTTQLVTTASAESGVPVAWAMAATIGSEGGWYQIAGLATALKTAVAVTPGVPIYISGTSGRIKVIASTGKGVIGSRSANLTTISAGVSSVVIRINRPSIAGFES